MKTCPHTGKPLKISPLDPAFFLSMETGVLYYKEARSVPYDDQYFQNEYKDQYGKTYLEDEENLRALAKRRLKRIEKYRKAPSAIFEIGCAAGFFLDEAKSMGYSAGGMEISGFAAKHASEKLKLNIINHSFLENPVREIQKHFSPPFDIIASYFTLEHFSDQKAVFENIALLLKKGGILSLSLPSTNGPLFFRHPADWVRTHPKDHFADYSPQSLRKILPLYGLRVIEIRPSSYHPERLHPIFRIRALRFLYRKFADFFEFGDTMDVIAEKIR